MEKHIDLQTFNDDDGPRARVNGSMSEAKGKGFDKDRYELARAGKQQVLKVRSPLLARSCLSELTMAASLWLGQYDRSFVWSYVHLGKSTRVSDCPPARQHQLA